MSGGIVAIYRVAFVVAQGAVAADAQPEQDLGAGGQVQVVVPVVEAAGANDAKEPGPAIIVDGVGGELVAGERVVVVNVVDLKVTGAQGHTVERGLRVGIGVVGEVMNRLAGKRGLRPVPGANLHGQSRLHIEMDGYRRREAHDEVAAARTIDARLLRRGDVDERGRQDLLRTGRRDFENDAAEGDERVLRVEREDYARLQGVAVLADHGIQRLYRLRVGIAENRTGIGHAHGIGENGIAAITLLHGVEDRPHLWQLRGKGWIGRRHHRWL